MRTVKNSETELTGKLRNQKKKYYADYFTEHINNIKNLGDGIKNIVNLKKTSNRTTQLNIRREDHRQR